MDVFASCHERHGPIKNLHLNNRYFLGASPCALGNTPFSAGINALNVFFVFALSLWVTTARKHFANDE